MYQTTTGLLQEILDTSDAVGDFSRLTRGLASVRLVKDQDMAGVASILVPPQANTPKKASKAKASGFQGTTVFANADGGILLSTLAGASTPLAAKVRI